MQNSRINNKADPTATRGEMEKTMVKICYPWKMCGRYEDNFESTIGGYNEEDCMEKLIDLQEKHGALERYSGFCDEDYKAGEYIGKENFIY